MNRIVAIDPGLTCGMVVLDYGRVTESFLLDKSLLFTKITSFLIYPACTVVIEDMRPYSMRLTPQVIETCKWIGEAVYRLKNDAGATVELIHRNEVKKWVFDAFPSVCMDRIRAKIEKKDQRIASTGEFRKPHFVYVDDKIVMEAMKVHFNIPLPPSGKGYAHGLKNHSWQALAVGAFWLSKSP